MRPPPWAASSVPGYGWWRWSACLRPVFEFAPHLLQVLRFLQQSFDHLDHRFAGFGHRDDALAMTHEDLDPELVLELANLLGHTGLGGKELLGCFREIQALPDGLTDVS